MFKFRMRCWCCTAANSHLTLTEPGESRFAQPVTRKGFLRLSAKTLLALAAMDPHWQPAVSDDGLLDPTQVGKNKAAPANDDLLDPARIGVPSRTGGGAVSDGGAAEGRTFDPLRGSSMASDVVRTLNELTVAATAIDRELKQIKEDISQFTATLQRLLDEREAKLDEVRNGLFCSGCMRTKSEILAKGETFPHPGQHVVRATPQQIRDKETELQRPIDELNRKIEDRRKRDAHLRANWDELLDQIMAGCALWRTSMSYRLNALDLNEFDAKQRYENERAAADAQLEDTRFEMMKAVPGATRDKLRREVDFWQSTLNQLDSKRESEVSRYKSAAARARTDINGQFQQLNEYLDRGGLRDALSLPLNMSRVSRRSGLQDKGGAYRLGDFSVARHGDILPRVRDFVMSFMRLRNPSDPLDQQVEPSAPPCKPTKDHPCIKSGNAGPGERG